jgi:hypothetical protein
MRYQKGIAMFRRRDTGQSNNSYDLNRLVRSNNSSYSDLSSLSELDRSRRDTTSDALDISRKTHVSRDADRKSIHINLGEASKTASDLPHQLHSRSTERRSRTILHNMYRNLAASETVIKPVRHISRRKRATYDPTKESIVSKKSDSDNDGITPINSRPAIKHPKRPLRRKARNIDTSKQILRRNTNQELNDKDANLELDVERHTDFFARWRAKKGLEQIHKQKRVNKFEFFKGGLHKPYLKVLDAMVTVVSEDVKTAIEPKVHSKPGLQSDKGYEIVGKKRDDDKEKSTIHNTYAKLNAISLFKRAKERSLSEQPEFIRVEKAVLRKDLIGVRNELQEIKKKFDTDQTHLQAHGIVDIETGKITLNNGNTLQLHEIKSITSLTSNNPYPVISQWKIKTSSTDLQVSDAIAQPRSNKEHLINFKTGRIELANGTRIDLKDIDWEKNKDSEPTKLHMKQSAAFYVDGSTLNLKDAARPVEARELVNRQKYEEVVKQYRQAQMALLEKVAYSGSSSLSDMHALLAGIRTNEYALIKVAEHIAELPRADGSVTAYHFQEEVRRIRNDAASGLLHIRQSKLNKASQEYAKALKSSAYAEISGTGFSRLSPSDTVSQIRGIQHGHIELQNNKELPRYDELKAKSTLTAEETAELQKLEQTLERYGSPITRNSYHIRKIAEYDAEGRLEHAKKHIGALENVHTDNNDSNLVKARKAYENTRVEHIREAYGEYKKKKNPNEMRMALYEERYHGSIIRYNTNRAIYALENTITKNMVPHFNVKRLEKVRNMHLEDIITDPNKLSNELEAFNQASQRAYDKKMYRVKPHEFRPHATGLDAAAENAANFTKYARDRARYEVQKLIDETDSVNDKNKMIENRGDYEKDFVEKFTKMYGEERVRAHEFERVKLARKTMNDFARKQFFLSLVANFQMAYNSFDQSVDSTMNSIIRSSTRTA